MSRRCNCYDNAVAESFFKTLKKEYVRKYIFKTREEAKRKIFEYIEMFYNPKRRHSYLNYLSPNNFEIRYYAEIEKQEVLATDLVSTEQGSFHGRKLVVVAHSLYKSGEVYDKERYMVTTGIQSE